jgi:hypothetical protein
VLTAACGHPSAEPGEAAAPPRLAIEIEGGFSDAAGWRSLEAAPAQLQLADATASATLDLRRESLPDATDGVPQIDVRLRKKQRLFGMRHFELRNPAAVVFQVGPLLHEQLRREGVLAARIHYVRVALNGVDLGLMALEERCAKELLESQRRRQGVLFRLDAGELPTARIDAFDARKVARSKQMSAELRTAAGLLQAFLRAELPARDVFDEELTARFLAIAEIWRAESLLRPESLRFYFNPITQRLEPVVAGGRLRLASDPDRELVSSEGWPALLLADAELRAATLRNLRRLAGEMVNGETRRWMDAEERPLLRGLRREHPGLSAVAFDPRVARARGLGELGDADLARTAAGSPRAELVAAPDVASLRRNPIPTASLEDSLQRHPFLTWDAARRRLRAASGTWVVRGSLVLPEGVGLDLVPGTTLRFGEGEMLLGSGPLHFRGGEDAPVVLEGLPASAGAGTWQGLAVLRSGAPHIWEHVVVRNTTGIDRDGWRLTGGVTLRASRVQIDSSRFSGNRAEDAVNLIRSGFTFRGVSIREASSDAFDCDFCEGRVIGGRISAVGGDGIDVSGSDVQVDGGVFEDIRDKAISVGERSRLVARNLEIRSVGTAVAGKDGSEVIFEDSSVSDVRNAAIMAYIKKAEFGPGRVSARNIRMSGVARAAVAQHGSRIDIDGVAQVPEEVDVEDLYERGVMKK